MPFPGTSVGRRRNTEIVKGEACSMNSVLRCPHGCGPFVFYSVVPNQCTTPLLLSHPLLGHENHGVHVCHKCGWPFPNPHPSAKHRRAHKKICGTIEGYKLCVSEGQTHLHGSDDEHVSDDDHKTPGLVVLGSNALDTGNNVKGNDGNGEKIIRSEDEVFSDAVADFLDSGLSPGNKEPLQKDSLDTDTDVEKVDTKEQKFSGSSEHNDFNDESQLIVKSSNDCQIENPKLLQSESVGVGNTVELQGQLSGSAVDPLASSVADLRTEELTIVRGDDYLGLSRDSHPSKAEPMPDVLPEKNVYAGENVRNCDLIYVVKETNLQEKDEIISERNVVEVVDSSDDVVGETCEGVSATAVSDAVSLDHQVGDGAVDLKEKNSAEFHSLLAQDDLHLELNSSVITNDAQVESAHVMQFATSSDVKILQEKRGNVNIDPLRIHDDRPDVTRPQCEYEDFKNQDRVVSQDPLSLHSPGSLKHVEDESKDPGAEENNFHFNTNQLSEKSDVLSSDMHDMDSSMKTEQVNSESMTEDKHAEDCTEVSTVKLTVESYQISHEIGASKNALKTEVNENHMVHFSEEQGPNDTCEITQQISLPEGRLMASSNESHRDASIGSAISETTSEITTDTISHHEKNRTEINDVTVDGKGVRANVENDTEIILKDLQPSDLLQSEVNKSSDLLRSDDGGEMGKIEQCDIIDAQCKERNTERDTSSPKFASSHFESPVILDAVIAESVRKSNGTECANIDSLSAAQEKEDEINSNIKINEEYNRSDGTSIDSHEVQDAELSVKVAEDLATKYASVSLNAEPSAQHGSAVEDNPGGEPGREMSGISAVPVQDQSGGNNLVKHGSSGFDASVDSGSRCDSLEGNWGSVSVLSMQSDAPAVIDAENLSSTGLLTSTEAGKSNQNNPEAASEKQQSGKSEMFEPPSFMTLVESSHVVNPKGASSEVQSRQQPNSTSQAGWFPTLTQVMNESQGRKKNEEIIAKVTNWSTSKEHTPLKSLLGEPIHSNNPKSPKVEENSVNPKNGKVSENNGSGLTTVNSILGPESPTAQLEKGDAAKEWNSPARYPADIKREKRKFKSRPYWIQLVCCSTVDPRRR
ncbi:Zinc finger C2H2-type [Sesbania bispinosa]|nr:Zinc finger C2H2-type [Sesbania bispinosa]